jgi:hypothetical protein
VLPHVNKQSEPAIRRTDNITCPLPRTPCYLLVTDTLASARTIQEHLNSQSAAQHPAQRSKAVRDRARAEQRERELTRSTRAAAFWYRSPKASASARRWYRLTLRQPAPPERPPSPDAETRASSPSASVMRGASISLRRRGRSGTAAGPSGACSD